MKKNKNYNHLQQSLLCAGFLCPLKETCKNYSKHAAGLLYSMDHTLWNHHLNDCMYYYEKD